MDINGQPWYLILWGLHIYTEYPVRFQAYGWGAVMTSVAFPYREIFRSRPRPIVAEGEHYNMMDGFDGKICFRISANVAHTLVHLNVYNYTYQENTEHTESISGSERRWKRGVECPVNVVPPAQRVIIRAVLLLYCMFRSPQRSGLVPSDRAPQLNL